MRNFPQRLGTFGSTLPGMWVRVLWGYTFQKVQELLGVDVPQPGLFFVHCALTHCWCMVGKSNDCLFLFLRSYIIGLICLIFSGLWAVVETQMMTGWRNLLVPGTKSSWYFGWIRMSKCRLLKNVCHCTKRLWLYCIQKAYSWWTSGHFDNLWREVELLSDVMCHRVMWWSC